MVDYSGVDDDDNCDEFEITGDCEQDAETMKFDEIIGALEEFIMNPEFQEAQEAFCRGNCGEFEDTDENKLVYTDAFDRYTAMLETAMEAHLAATVEGFSMAEFSGMLETRKDELYGDVFDLLTTLSSFDAFKARGLLSLGGGRGSLGSEARMTNSCARYTAVLSLQMFGL